MVLDVKTGVVKAAPVASKLPPDAASYHCRVPPGAVAVNVAAEPGQIVVPEAEGARGVGLTATVTGVLALAQLFTVVCT